MDRRKCLYTLSALGIVPFLPASFYMQSEIIKRPIPSSNETLPVVGVGTWQTFDVGSDQQERKQLKDVLKTLVEKGGTVVDSSPMYGSSEQVVGDLSTETNLNKKLFIGTKVWTRGKDDGIRQMNNSFSLLKRDTIDLMQIHNLVDWQTHLKTLRGWKEKGKVRYIGITHYTESAYSNIEDILKTTPLDFLQINYSLLSRKAEERLFPLAQEKGVAVIINQPFESGSLFGKTNGKSLPEWTKEFDCNSWGQFFLKFIIAHPAVNCVIPGTAKVHHMVDNISAGYGKLPTAAHRKQMVNLLS